VRFAIFATGRRQPRLIAMTRSKKHEISATAVTAATGNFNMWPTTTIAA